MTRAESWPTSLRLRIILALVLIVTTMSTLFAYGVLEIKSKLEEVILRDTVRNQLVALEAQREAGIFRASHLFEHWDFYFDEQLAELPARLRELEPGSYHSIIIDGRYYQVEVGTNADGERLVLTYDITTWENQEHEVLEFLAYGIAVQLFAAVVLGWFASRAILAPVRAFTRLVSGIEPRQRNVRIAEDFQGNEIGLIAAEFDHYLARLDRFVERERFFTAAASHELRTPLSVMLGALDILDTAPLDGPTARARQRMHRACDEMTAFIEAALLIAREEASTIEMQQSCNVTTVVNDLLEDHQPALASRNIAIKRSQQGTTMLELSPSLIRIVIGNLLRNAIEHTRDGTISIHLSPTQIVVNDTGTGIPAADLPRVFDRSYTTKQDGNGLGLNLVKRICDRFGWRIDILSDVGQGTSVTLTLTP